MTGRDRIRQTGRCHRRSHGIRGASRSPRPCPGPHGGGAHPFPDPGVPAGRRRGAVATLRPVLAGRARDGPRRGRLRHLPGPLHAALGAAGAGRLRGSGPDPGRQLRAGRRKERRVADPLSGRHSAPGGRAVPAPAQPTGGRSHAGRALLPGDGLAGRARGGTGGILAQHVGEPGPAVARDAAAEVGGLQVCAHRHRRRGARRAPMRRRPGSLRAGLRDRRPQEPDLPGDADLHRRSPGQAPPSDRAAGVFAGPFAQVDLHGFRGTGCSGGAADREPSPQHGARRKPPFRTG